VTYLLNQVLERKSLTLAQALAYVKQKRRRNRAATRAHHRRYKRRAAADEQTLTL
jgi:hypothetical protein